MSNAAVNDPTILIVEDAEDTLRLFELVFVYEGYRVVCAESVPEALGVLRGGERIDALLTDFNLRGETGCALIHQARNERLLDAAAPVLICTAYTSVEPPPGVVVLHKPIDPMIVVGAVRSALSRGGGVGERAAPAALSEALAPAVTSAKAEAPSLVVSGVHARSGRVLIIDDEPFVAEAICPALSGENHVAIETSAEAALARLTSSGERFDVVLCDVMTSGIDGMELHDRLARTNPAAAAGIVFMTGGAFLPTIQAFLDRVPNLCLVKPLDVAGLRALIDERVRGPASAPVESALSDGPISSVD